MSNQIFVSDLLMDLSAEEQQFLAGGQDRRDEEFQRDRGDRGDRRNRYFCRYCYDCRRD
ncbi:hypothetical protein ACN23B_18900 [Anabaena sp. FACHB-709]|uniref:Uncharacterized protein n=2 Tax=Nostocaceae TaxID=1162 RepID=A0A1Z4KK92_ANAVA|nr:MULTISPECIES: hypothetical protein [Nostocaceae]BAY69389.1 hypothetical protein NIES23_21830 [Trichormus variabilis NIES-23]MBD2171140.1 hypothetical protein [Anabaena cylindrica FACHB-318]MBD2262920.1 hypothetical protein [Anabaena sp. FACHB-709]MBD2272283.1 hypothetical protein [Nostoc sp. PCC 7120 = FACHB-418]MBD2283519.1 hypothetical protein [Anabaena cylindrica FACHB-170]